MCAVIINSPSGRSLVKKLISPMSVPSRKKEGLLPMISNQPSPVKDQRSGSSFNQVQPGCRYPSKSSRKRTPSGREGDVGRGVGSGVGVGTGGSVRLIGIAAHECLPVQQE